MRRCVTQHSTKCFRSVALCFVGLGVALPVLAQETPKAEPWIPTVELQRRRNKVGVRIGADYLRIFPKNDETTSVNVFRFVAGIVLPFAKK